MMLMIPKGYETAGPDFTPDPEAVATMTEYNRSMQEAGILKDVEALRPPATGVRVTFRAGTPTVHDGPFEGVQETLGGYWIIEVGSRDEAVSWAKKCPAADNETIEVREMETFEDSA
jgi:hypothetical protein